MRRVVFLLLVAIPILFLTTNCEKQKETEPDHSEFLQTLDKTNQAYLKDVFAGNKQTTCWTEYHWYEPPAMLRWVTIDYRYPWPFVCPLCGDPIILESVVERTTCLI